MYDYIKPTYECLKNNYLHTIMTMVLLRILSLHMTYQPFPKYLFHLNLNFHLKFRNLSTSPTSSHVL